MIEMVMTFESLAPNPVWPQVASPTPHHYNPLAYPEFAKRPVWATNTEPCIFALGGRDKFILMGSPRGLGRLGKYEEDGTKSADECKDYKRQSVVALPVRHVSGEYGRYDGQDHCK